MKKKELRLFTPVFLAVALIMSSCGVQLVSGYDQVIVDGINGFLLSSYSVLDQIAADYGTVDASYDSVRASYRDLETQIEVLLIHADAAQSDSSTIHMLENVASCVAHLDSAHSAGPITPEQIRSIYRPAIRLCCLPILTVEYAKAE